MKIKMDKEKVEEIVFKAISAQSGKKVDELTLETNLINGLGLDSLDMVELLMELEDAFNIRFPDDDMTKITTIKDVLDYLSKYIK